MRRFACILSIVIVNAISAQDESWVGKTVVTKYHGISITRTNGKGKDEIIGKLNDNITYRVKAEKGERIQVQTTDGLEGWFDKSDAFLPAAAVDHFIAEIKRDKSDAGAFQKRSIALALTGKLDAAIFDATEVISLARFDAAGWNQLGNLHIAKRDYARAVKDLTQAARLDPTSAAIRSNRGYALICNREYAKAIAELDLAIQMAPKLAYAYNNRGLAHFFKKEYIAAQGDFDEAEKLDRHNAWLYRNRAWMLATCAEAKYRNGKTAVELATKALTLTDNPDAGFHQTLAAAHAEATNFDEAVRVLEALQTDKRWAKDADVRTQIDLHRQKKAVRQE